jgi:hypothetical protein
MLINYLSEYDVDHQGTRDYNKYQDGKLTSACEKRFPLGRQKKGDSPTSKVSRLQGDDSFLGQMHQSRCMPESQLQALGTLI